MRKLKILYLTAGLVLAAGAFAGTAEARKYTVVTNLQDTQDGHVTRIGSFRVRDGNYRTAVRAFGKPSSVRNVNGCRVRWNKIGLTIWFVNLGGPAQCNGYPQAMRATGPDFVTLNGLSPGMPSTAITGLYPNAKFHADHQRWWLVTANTMIGGDGINPTDYAALSVSVTGGRITALHGWIGAAGE
jgi:hypothetical protein